MPPFQFVRDGECRPWPSGFGEAWVASIAVADAELESRLGAGLDSYPEEGLGPERGVTLVLASGRPVVLVRYGLAPEAFHLFADAFDDLAAALAGTLAAVGLPADRVSDSFERHPDYVSDLEGRRECWRRYRAGEIDRDDESARPATVPEDDLLAKAYREGFETARRLLPRQRK